MDDDDLDLDDMEDMQDNQDDLENDIESDFYDYGEGGF